jgi:hypothetical protein
MTFFGTPVVLSTVCPVSAEQPISERGKSTRSEQTHRRKERRMMKYTIVLVSLVISFLSTGCMAGYYAHHERRQMMERDSLQPPPMTVDDVIALAQDSVGDEVILEQIKATHSAFQLTNNDIRDLKKSGVSERVISAMIKTSNQPRNARARTSYYGPYSPYADYYWYPYSSFYYPWYPSAYLGFAFRGGYYHGYHFGGFRGLRVHR